MPPGTKRLDHMTIPITPQWQPQGVGSALLRWGTDHADKSAVFC